MPVLIYGIEAWGDTKKEDKVTGKKTTRQSNRQEKINMEKRNEEESDIKGKSKNDFKKWQEEQNVEQ